MYNIAVVTTTLPGNLSDNDVMKFQSSPIEQGLCACSQSQRIDSSYMWKGELQHDAEWSITLKTTLSKLEHLIAYLDEAHPYDVPQIVYNKETTTQAYYSWMLETLVD